MDDFHAKFLRRLARMEGKLRFGSGEEVSDEALALFYNQAFPERAAFLINHWRWLYQVGRGNAFSSPLLAIAEDRVVGHGGMIKVILQRGHDRREAIWMMDFAILPEHQRGMIGGGLVQIGSSFCPLRIAFLNERSWGMVSKLGWRSHFHSTAYQLPLHPEKLAQVQAMTRNWVAGKTVSTLGGLAIRAIGRALTAMKPRLELLPASSESLEPFIQARNHTSLHVPRSAEFLEWRVLSHPHAKEFFVFMVPGDEKCLALARVIKASGHRRLQLLSVHNGSGNPNALSDLFAGIIRWALSASIDTILFLTSDPAVARIAARWLPVKSPQRFAYHADDDAGWSYLGEIGQTWELLDSDFEMMLESE